MTDAEVEDAVEKIMKILTKHGEKSIAFINVDNAARKVANLAADRLAENGLIRRPRCSRDAAHSTDLVLKDFASIAIIKLLYKYVNEMYSFVSIDRIDSICDAMIGEGAIAHVPKAQKNADTRFHGLVDYFSSMRDQKEFLSLVVNHPLYQQYYNERSSSRQQSLDDMFDRINNKMWKRLELACLLMTPFKKAIKFLSGSNTPGSALLYIVQALVNETRKTLEISGFASIMGDGTIAEIMDILDVRCNLDCKDPAGPKVGILEDHNAWLVFTDPYGDELPCMVDGNHAAIVTAMINYYIPGDSPKAEADRRSIRQEYMVSTIVLCTYIYITYISWDHALLT